MRSTPWRASRTGQVASREIAGEEYDASAAGAPKPRLSGAAKSEGKTSEKIEGRKRSSEWQVAIVGIAQDGVDDIAITSQHEAQLIGMPEHGARVTTDGRVVCRGWGVEQGVFDVQGAVESDEGRLGEVDDDHLWSDEEAIELSGGHRFFAPAGGLGLGVWAKTSRKSFSSRRASSRSAATASSSSARFIRTR